VITVAFGLLVWLGDVVGLVGTTVTT